MSALTIVVGLLIAAFARRLAGRGVAEVPGTVVVCSTRVAAAAVVVTGRPPRL